jgi:hypothetical protein
MEKGAIRKLSEPAAEAELPPTKDGYYHMGDVNEVELSGQPRMPFRRYDALGRELDEQKFLLDDLEMSRIRREKMRSSSYR